LKVGFLSSHDPLFAVINSGVQLPMMTLLLFNSFGNKLLAVVLIVHPEILTIFLELSNRIAFPRPQVRVVFHSILIFESDSNVIHSLFVFIIFVHFNVRSPLIRITFPLPSLPLYTLLLEASIVTPSNVIDHLLVNSV
jgi:hypothetical protein